MKHGVKYLAAFDVVEKMISVVDVPKNPIKVKRDQVGPCIIRIMDDKSYKEAQKGATSDRKVKNGIDSTVRILFEAPSQKPARK